MFELKPDYEQCKKRIDAFWERELIDRPVVQFGLFKPPDERMPVPGSTHRIPTERWLDTSSNRVRESYAMKWESHMEMMKEIFSRAGVDSVSLRTGEDYVKPLMWLFKQR